MSELYAYGVTGEQMGLLKHRQSVSRRICDEKGWDIAHLTIQQILYIRNQPEWKSLPAKAEGQQP